MKIGIITANPPELHRRFMEAAPPDIETSVVADSASDEEKASTGRDADAIILVAPTVSVEVLRNCPKVKLLQGTRAGYERLGTTWIAEENPASLRQMEKLAARPLHRLHLYRKDLEGVD